jgi:hypothetical protein
MATLCGSFCAQAQKTVVIRMLDSKTGKLIESSHFLVRINHEQAIHANWVVQNEDGTGKLTLPDGASVFSIQGTYDSAELIYINCDSATGKADPAGHWYSVPEILSTGIATPNGCVKPKEAAKLKHAAKPGEFVFFVRKQSVWQQLQDDYSSR